MEADHGTIFNIQKFSLNDGPGIRTVVFLKGCPLRCRWCANPESQLPGEQPLWDGAKCLRCRRCVKTCPSGAITLTDAGMRVDPGRCTGCGLCIEGCPARALTGSGEEKTVAEIMDIVMQDLPFYEESGGGVTLSGGEVLAQPHFARALLRACHEEGLHTCCETTGYASPGLFRETMEDADYILFDVKHWDSGAHIRGTGVPVEPIFANLRQAAASGKEVLPRIPVIPGFNDAPEDAAGLAEYIKRAGLSRCQLLPFHQFGEKKYEQLGKAYAYRDVPAYHREELEAFRSVFAEHDVNAFF